MGANRHLDRELSGRSHSSPLFASGYGLSGQFYPTWPMEALNEVLEKPLRHSQSLKNKNRAAPCRRPVHGRC
jgi:hypothetical protein